MKKSLVIALLLATARAEEEAAADAEEAKGAEENYACDSSTENTGCGEKLRCQLRPALTAFWTAEELATQDKKTLTAHNEAETAANATAREDWTKAKEALEKWTTAKGTYDTEKKAFDDDAKTNSDAKTAYDTAKKACADATTPNATPVADYTGAVGADGVCTATLTFTANTAGTTTTQSIAYTAADANGVTGVFATLSLTLTASEDGNQTQVVLAAAPAYADANGAITDQATIDAYNALAGNEDLATVAAGDVVGFLIKGADGNLPAFTAMADLANLEDAIPNPAYTALVEQPVATPAADPGAWTGGDAPALEPTEQPALYVALTELPAAKKAKPEGSRAAAGAAAAPAATGEAADGEEAKEEEDPADGPGVCVPEAECDKEGVFCGAAQLTAGLIVSLALAASL